MSEDLSRFCTKQYVAKLQNLPHGTKIKVLRSVRSRDDLQVGKIYYIEGREDEEELEDWVRGRSQCGQTKWIRLQGHSGYFIGTDAYVFQIVNEDSRIAYAPWNKPSV